MRGRGVGIQDATSAVGRGGRAARGHCVIPKDCKRLTEVDLLIAEVLRHAGREKSIRRGHPSRRHRRGAARQTANNWQKEGPDE